MAEPSLNFADRLKPSRLKHATAAWLAARRDESCRCADCDTEVSPWDNLCPGCGLANPARIQIPWPAYVAIGVVCLLVITLLVVV